MSQLGLPMRPDDDKIQHDAGQHDAEIAASGTARRGAGTARSGGRGYGRSGRRAVWVALVVLLALAAGVWFLGAGVSSHLQSAFGGPADYPGPGGAPTQVRILPGATAADIGQVLLDAGVVASRGAFVDAARADPQSTNIQPGTYRLPTKLPATAALAALLDPANRLLTRVTVPEGLRLDETLNLLAQRTSIPRADLAAAVARAAKDPGILGLPAYAEGHVEGYLFPATYDVEPDTTATQLLSAMVSAYLRTAQQAGLTDGARPPHELLTIASLVEAEARRPEDRGPVARVIDNRLAAGMPLQLDATVNYVLNADKTLVTYSDLQVKSAYNTYQHPGLPPGPINSPGLAAMQAAVNPPAGDWLYFVTVNPSTGQTKFTASYQEFLRFTAELKANQ